MSTGVTCWLIVLPVSYRNRVNYDSFESASETLRMRMDVSVISRTLYSGSSAYVTQRAKLYIGSNGTN